MTQTQINKLSAAKAQALALSLADSLGVVIHKKVCGDCGGVWVALDDPTHDDIETYGYNCSYHYIMIGGVLIKENKAECIPF